MVSWLIAFIAIMIVSFYWVQESHKMPLDGDAICFVPVSKNIVLSGEWSNEFYRPGKVVHPDKPDLYIWHGWLQPTILAKLSLLFQSSAGTYTSLRLAGILTSVIGLTFFGAIVSKLTAQQGLAIQLLGGISIVAASTYLDYNGRPESIVSGLILGGFFVIQSVPHSSRPFFIGAISAGIFFSHPIAAILLGPLVLIAVVFPMPDRNSLVRDLAKIGVSFGLCFCLLSAIIPFPFFDWIKGMRLHAENAVVGNVKHSFIRYWLGSPWNPLLAFASISAIAPCLYHSLSKKDVRPLISSLWIFWFLIFYYFCIRAPNRNYNFVALLPLLIIASFTIIEIHGKMVGNSKISKFMPLIYALFCFTPGVLDVSRTSVAYFLSSDGITRGECSELLGTKFQNMVVSDNVETKGLFELSDRFKVKQVFFAPQSPSERFYVLQQFNSRNSAPPVIEGYHLTWENFARIPPSVMGLPISRLQVGYNFAIYEANQ
jgi:hypothetical protein